METPEPVEPHHFRPYRVIWQTEEPDTNQVETYWNSIHLITGVPVLPGNEKEKKMKTSLAKSCNHLPEPPLTPCT